MSCNQNCNQGRDCPAQCDDDEELTHLETLLWGLIVTAALSVMLMIAGMVVGYMVGIA